MNRQESFDLCHDPCGLRGEPPAHDSTNPHKSYAVLSLLDGNDSFINKIKIPQISTLNFEVDGIPLNAFNHNEAGINKLTVWATLGYLPFSITSQQKRKALIQILEGSHRLAKAKIGISPDMKIVVSCVYEMATPPTPNYIFMPVLQFIQETRPFIRLIAEYL